jgi:nucleoside-diphosphate kinase
MALLFPSSISLILLCFFISFHIVESIKFSSSYQIIGKSVSTTSSSTHEKSYTERCFIAIKPDGVQRNLIGEIISRFEQKGLKLRAIKLIIPDSAIVKKQYASLQNASFFNDIMDFFTSGPIVAMVWEGENIITVARRLVGKTHPEDAEPGSIRGDFCSGKGRNLVHASDSIESADKEIAIWFQEDELVKYSKSIDQWVYPPPSRSPK